MTSAPLSPIVSSSRACAIRRLASVSAVGRDLAGVPLVRAALTVRKRERHGPSSELEAEMRILLDERVRQRRGNRMAAYDALVGSVLIQIRDQCPRGKWLEWVDEESGIARRTAQRYIRTAEVGLEGAPRQPI